MEQADDQGAARREAPKRAWAALNGAPLGDPTQETYAELVEAYRHFNEALFDGRLNTPVMLTLRASKTMSYFSKERFVKDGIRSHEIALNPKEFAIHDPKECLARLVSEMVHQRLAEQGLEGRRGYTNGPCADLMRDLGLPTTNRSNPERSTGDAVAFRIERGGKFDVAADRFLARYSDDEATGERWADRFLSHATLELARSEAVARKESQAGPSVEMAQGGEVQAGPNEAGPAAATAAESGDASKAAPVEITFKVDDVVVPAKSQDPAKIKYQCPQCGWAVWGKSGMALVCGVDAVVLRQMNLPAGEVQRTVKLHPAIRLKKEPELAYWERKRQR